VRSLGYDDDGCDATQASVVNDDYADGHPFMQNHTGAFPSAGGLALPSMIAESEVLSSRGD
jgi:hypothetical protein